jgi:hypothetical protein
MGMVWGKWFRELWWRCSLCMHEIVQYKRLRDDYLKITWIPPRVFGAWMDGEARLRMLGKKEVDAIGSEACQRELFY